MHGVAVLSAQAREELSVTQEASTWGQAWWRATTAMVASRHSQCSQAPPRGGSRDFVPAL